MPLEAPFFYANLLAFLAIICYRMSSNGLGHRSYYDINNPDLPKLDILIRILKRLGFFINVLSFIVFYLALTSRTPSASLVYFFLFSQFVVFFIWITRPSGKIKQGDWAGDV